MRRGGEGKAAAFDQGLEIRKPAQVYVALRIGDNGIGSRLANRIE